MSFEEFKKLLAYIKEHNYARPTPLKKKLNGNYPIAVTKVECGVDYNSGCINRIDIYAIGLKKKEFHVSKDLDSWTIQRWLCAGIKPPK